MPRLARTLLPMLFMTLPMIASASDVTRYKLPNSTFPISAAVEVPAGKTMVYLSGQMGQMPKDANAAKGVPVSTGWPGAMGDTRTQTISALSNIKKELEGMHLSMGDVVKMQVFLVADKSKGDKLDFAGFMGGYTQFFGTKEQPNLPSRSAVQVQALVIPAALVEIEVTAVRP